ncbi:MAG: hypothetical protein CVT81_16250 [Alphaproteobacteria bacterium HGW-Alphaproteobacteria-3]|nr:MAG: hypothetical protein CVT81_16250 [Alphaproteobacteria bacterium HGW-Alphaproteobacteria-3]
MQVSTLSQSLALRQSINDMRAQFDDLQRQLSTGLKTDSYAKLGTDRNSVLSLTHQLGQISAYTNTISKTQMRIEVMSTTLTRVNDIVSETKTSLATSGFELVNGTQTSAQVQAAMTFDEMVNLLNLQVEDRYLFGGKDTQTRPVALRSAGTTVTLAEDADPSVFGFKIAAVQSTLSNASVTGPAGSPQGADVDFTGLPAAGETISFALNLPDGTATTVTLKATTNNPAEAGEFTIGGDATATSANFQAALDTAIQREANVTLRAASAVEAADNFFDYAAGGLPQRVDGPPFGTATGLRDATADDTVIWYSGDLGPNAGKDFVAQIDESRQLAYGARADQASIRDTLKMSALLAAAEYSDADDLEQRDSYRALTSRAGQVLNFKGVQSVESIVTNLGLAASTLSHTQDRHDATMASANEILGDIQNADAYEVGVKLTTLQTQLQASFQVTSLLSQLSLVNYIR